MVTINEGFIALAECWYDISLPMPTGVQCYLVFDYLNADKDWEDWTLCEDHNVLSIFDLLVGAAES